MERHCHAHQGQGDVQIPGADSCKHGEEVVQRLQTWLFWLYSGFCPLEPDWEPHEISLKQPKHGLLGVHGREHSRGKADLVKADDLKRVYISKL